MRNNKEKTHVEYRVENKVLGKIVRSLPANFSTRKKAMTAALSLTGPDGSKLAGFYRRVVKVTTTVSTEIVDEIL